MHVDRLLRQKTLPVTLSLPWGLSIGLVGLAPYLPLPAKLVTSVLPAMRPRRAEPPEAFGDRVEQAMQAELTALTEHRRFLLG
jgi:hypothetical protein